MKKNYYLTTQHPTTLLLAIDAPYNKTTDIQSYFDEFVQLVRTNQITYDKLLCMRTRDVDSAFFLTEGKLQHVKETVDKLDAQEIIISEPLTPQQERNLSRFLRCRVFDRTHLILEIFEKAAKTAEGKLQVEIAMLRHKKSRLAGKGVQLGQQKGTIGLRAGAGETLKEKETRHIEQHIRKLKKQLDKLEQTRETQRKRRLKSDVPLVCLVGYTNAGKSTIMNALTKSDVLAEDKLFATLDTTTRELHFGDGKKILLSDTVGFIQMLPPRLIEAFKSTLSELHYADLLLHVVDLSSPNWQDHIKTVLTILDELEIDKPVLYVFNKADAAHMNSKLEADIERFQPHVLISALDKRGIETLRSSLRTFFAASLQVSAPSKKTI